MTAKLYRNPSEGRVEWDGYRDFELFLQVAQEVGLWVIARPGLVPVVPPLSYIAFSTDVMGVWKTIHQWRELWYVPSSVPEKILYRANDLTSRCSVRSWWHTWACYKYCRIPEVKRLGLL